MTVQTLHVKDRKDRKQRQAKRPAMTAAQATTFEHTSAENAAYLETCAALRGCTCQPYADWFTYNRWGAQGFQVRKGEHGVKLSIVISKDSVDDDGKVKTASIPWTTTVFCRCQVDAKA